MDLTELAAKHGTDKAVLGYMPLYEQYFQKHNFTQDRQINILEIGIHAGASLRMWAEAFPNAQVHGIDLYDRRVDHPRIHTHIVNQGSLAALNCFLEDGHRFDLIIDDGSHDQYDQQLSFAVLFRKLNNGGLYVIEDLITGDDWWYAKSTHNKHHIQPTRLVMQEFGATGKLPGHFLNGREIEQQHDYCHYREAAPHGKHFHQLAFIGKKDQPLPT